MSDQLIVAHASPTLAGLKTGSLFSVPYESRACLNGELRCLNGVLSKKGLRAVPVRYTDTFALIYLYRPDYLKRDLEHTEAGSILEGMGYPCGNVNHCVAALEKKLREAKEFPHEIGLFLGYPPGDVLGFMRNPHCGYRAVGYWKVYGDVECARKTFFRYRKCSAVYADWIRRGRTLEQLIVRTAAG
jgi:hypothetical protein